MKRNTKQVEKRTFTLKNAFPTFVSLVTRGANLTPLSELRYSDTDKFSDVEINRMEFSKANFTAKSVEEYLTENDYSDFKVEVTDDAFVVFGVDSDQFEEISPVEYSDGLRIFVGKLKSEVEDSQPAAENVETKDVLEFSEPVEVSPNEDDDITQVQEGDLAVSDIVGNQAEQKDELENKDEEAVSTEQEPTGEEGEATVQASEVEQQEEVANQFELAVAKAKELFSAVQEAYAAFEAVTAEYTAAVAAIQPEEFSQEKEESMTREEAIELFQELFAAKTVETKEVVEEVVDETVIVVQNSQANQTQEEVHNIESKADPKIEKFNQRKNSNLFGF